MIPKLSIIIPTFMRDAAFTALMSSINSNFDLACIEVVIVSSDLKASKKFDQFVGLDYIKIIRADHRNPGESRKCSLYHYTNIGINHSTGEWLLIVNDDMLFTENFWTDFLVDIDSKKLQDGGILVIKTHIGSVDLGIRVPVVGRFRRSVNHSWEPLLLVDLAAIHRDTMKLIGGFDEGLDWYGSGVDNALATIFIANKSIIASDNCTILHDLNQAERELLPGNAIEDFNYILKKWKNKLGSSYYELVDIDLGVNSNFIYRILKKIQFKFLGAIRA